MSRILGVIPARLGSTRLPNKPLHPLLGAPLISWVWDRVRRMSLFDRVVVATDASEVMDVCQAMGAEAMLTSADHPSGTDRAQEVAQRVGGDFSVIVNVQGDEPLVSLECVSGAVAAARAPADVGTCAVPIRTRAELVDPSTVKVVRGGDGTALYFSRAAIPHVRDGVVDDDRLAAGPFLRHLGIYAYNRDALERWVSLPPSVLERVEKLEQLRALEAGMRIGVGIVEQAEGGVDTPEDAARMERRLQELGAEPPEPWGQMGKGVGAARGI